MNSILKAVLALLLVAHTQSVSALSPPAEGQLIQFRFLSELTKNPDCAAPSDFAAHMQKNGEEISISTKHGTEIFINLGQNKWKRGITNAYRNDDHMEKVGGFSYALGTVEVDNKESTVDFEYGILRERLLLNRGEKRQVKCDWQFELIQPLVES